MDSGGITGRMRVDSAGQEIAYSDALRTLLSLIDPKTLNNKKVRELKDLLGKRNDRGQDLGYTIFSHFFDNNKNGFENIQTKLEKLTDIRFKGQIIPITLKSTNIVFKTKLGRIYKGEHELDDKRMSKDRVTKMWLEPKVPAYKGAMAAVKGSDIVIFSCGSLYGSVLCNLLPLGMKKALRESKAKKILITNLASTRNETHNFTPREFVQIFKKYTGLSKPIDIMVVPELTKEEFEKKYPQVAKRYASEHSFFLGWDSKELEKVRKIGIKIITHQATIIEPKHLTLRHHTGKLGEVLKSLI